MAVEVSNAYKNMCKSNTPSGAIGRIKVIEDNITISESTDIQDIEIEDNCYVNDKFIGTTVAKKIKVNLFNDNNIYDLENKEIEAKLGFELNGSDELVSYGKFIIEKPDTEEVQAKTNFVGYDYMIKFNKDFVDNNTYPVALGTYFSNLCTQVGLVAGNTTFVNSDYMVQGNPFTNGEKCKDVLSSIAQIAGGIAKIGRDNKPYIISLSKGQALEEIDGNNYDTFEPNKVFGPINRLIIKMNDGVDGEESVRSDTQSITQNGECAITISNNPILNSAEQRELVIDNIFNSIKEITYLPFKTSYYGYPYVDSTDKINVLNVNDETKGSYIFNHTIKYDGAFTGSIETPALTKTQSMYKSTKDLKDWKRNVELKVDKINGSITALVETTEEIEKEIETITDTTGSAEGKYIYLDDSSDNTLISAKLYGETSQATRRGKNMLNNTATTQTINGITFTVNNDKSITVNGTSTAKTVYYLTGGSSQTLPIGEYRFSGCPSQSGTDYFIEVYRKNPDTYPRDYGTGNNLSITDNSQEILPYIVIQNGVTVNNIVFKPMIRLSSITDDTYEQYGVSPSPDYPSEIENLEGRNKFNINTARLNKALTWSTGEYFTDNGSVASDFIKIKNNKSYISKYFIQVILFDKNKTYLGKYGNSNTAVKTFTVNNTEVEYVKICFYSIANNSEDITLKQDLQLEENIVTTPYAPHNSLAVTVKNKNELNVPSLFQVIGYTDIDMEIATGVYTVSTENTETDVTENSFLIVFFSKDDNSKQYLYVSFSSKIATVELNKNISKIRIYAGGSYNGSVGKTTTFSKLMLEKNPTASDYIEPLEQTVYFPLEEGQKLYEGSYLAEDGIHNKIREINLAIADMNNGEDYPGWNNQTQLKNDYPELNTTFTQANIPYKSNISNVEHRFSLNTNGTGILFLAKSQWNMTQTQWQERYPDLVLKFQYGLKEEEIIPYNIEQQKAWNRIMELMTYKNITHIYSDAYAEIEYVKDNGLGIYETKANANRKYTETVEKFAQQQITNESITNTVSQTITTVANNYNELKTKFDDYAPASDVIALQRSVEQVITDTYTKTEINEKLIDGSVQKVSTTAGTFDSNGLTIEKTDAKTKGNFNEKGITVMDATSGQDEELLFAGYDEELNETIVRTKNLTVERYLTIKGVARQEKYVNPVLGGQGIGTFML